MLSLEEKLPKWRVPCLSPPCRAFVAKLANRMAGAAAAAAAAAVSAAAVGTTVQSRTARLQEPEPVNRTEEKPNRAA